MQDKSVVERNWLMGVTTLALSLVLVGAGCSGSTDPNGTPSAGSSEKKQAPATANVDVVTFSTANINVDCPDSGWNCSNQYGGEIALENNAGMLTVTEMFSNDVATAAKNQTERLVETGGKLVDEDTEGDAKVAVIEYADRNRTELIFFRKVGEKVFECKGTVESGKLNGDLEGQIADMCMSMEVAG